MAVTRSDDIISTKNESLTGSSALMAPWFLLRLWLANDRWVYRLVELAHEQQKEGEGGEGRGGDGYAWDAYDQITAFVGCTSAFTRAIDLASAE